MNSFLKRGALFTLFLIAPAVGLFAQHFVYTSNTGNNMTALVQASINPTVGGSAIANGDEIGVFTPAGLCVGSTIWNGSNTAITVWGDNDQTPATDGMNAGDTLKYRVWDASLSLEIPAVVAYSVGGPVYSVDGIAILSSLVAATYSVTYNGNGNTGGTAPADPTKYPQGTTVTVLGNTGSLAKAGSTFAGWNTAANGSGTSYTAGSTFTMENMNDTLYAKWTVNSYAITFDKNDAGAAGTMAQQTIQSGSSANLTPNAFTKTGYTFDGWATSSGGAVVYADRASYTMGTADDTLYAKWSAITYALNVSSSTGGNVSPSSATTVASGVPTPIKAIADVGYHFTHWTKISGSSTIADSTKDSTSVTLSSGNAEVRALFVKNTYTLSLAHVIGNAAPVADKDSVVNHGDTVRVTAPPISGDIFVKWRITVGTAILVDSTAQPAKVVLTSGNATLTAVYDKTTGILNQARSLPTAFDFSCNIGSSSIRIAVPRVAGYSSVTVSVRLYDLTGRLLSVLINKEMQAGYYNLKLAAGNNSRPTLGICRMETIGFSRAIKILPK